MANKKKIDIVESLTDKVRAAKSIVMLNYKGIKCNQLNEIKRGVKNDKVEYLVAKNRLFKIALKNAKIDKDFDAILKGPTSFVISYDDPLMASRVSRTFKLENKFVVIKGGLVENRVVTSEVIENLAKLPSREVLIAQFASLLTAPLARLQMALKEILSRG